MNKIMVIDDDARLIKFMKMNLESVGYSVSTYTDPRVALSNFVKDAPDLVLLDIMMPFMDGYEVLANIRVNYSVPVILLSAKDQVKDKLLGFDFGADDYLTKPFSLDELFARIKVHLRKINVEEEKVVSQKKYVYDLLCIDDERKEVLFDGKLTHLTMTEYRVLLYFLKRPEVAISYSELLLEHWGPSYVEQYQYLRVIVNRLRQKMKAAGIKNQLLHSVSGFGYILRNA